MTDVLAHFERIGRAIEREWKKCGCDERRFPEICCDRLSQLYPKGRIGFADLANFALDGELPPQADIEASFGQPPLTLYRGELFRIDALFWHTGVPGIHQHAFSGAFRVLAGASLHAAWSFNETHRVCAGLRIGQMRLLRTEVLVAGDTRPIVAGPQFIHCTFHLECPSVTLVVRTDREEEHTPQFSYWPPTLAYDPSAVGPRLRRRLQMLAGLAVSVTAKEFVEAVRLSIAGAYPLCAAHVLMESCTMLPSAFSEGLIAGERSRLGPLADAISAAVLESRFRDRIVRIKRIAKSDRDLSFLLALLLNLPSGVKIREMLRQRFSPGTCAGLAAEAARLAERLFPSGLGPDGEWLRHLEGLFDPDGAEASSAPDLDRHWLLGRLSSGSRSSASWG